MKGKIDEGGRLYIKRGGERGEFVKQFCPYVATGAAPCGHWCPRFEEEEDYGDREVSKVSINCCGQYVTIVEIIQDDRLKSEKRNPDNSSAVNAPDNSSAVPAKR